MVMLCSNVVVVDVLEREMLCLGRLFCTASFTCGHIGLDWEVRG